MGYRRRTSKLIARRHDLNYFKYTPGLRRWQWRATLLVAVIALLWVTAMGIRGRNAMFSAGPVSSPHAIFAKRCETCHTGMSGMGGTVTRMVTFKKGVPDAACLHCHVAPAHQAAQLFTPSCGSCHVEHTGSTHLKQVADSTCTQCHANLSSTHGVVPIADHIHSFTQGHPEFAAVRPGTEDTSHILFDHAAHLQPGLLGPGGKSRLQMTCADCHQTNAAAAAASWRFDAPAQAGDEMPAARQGVLFDGPETGRASMSQVRFQQNCRSCHTLQFDKHVDIEAPHASPERVHQFVLQQLQKFVAAHPEVIREEVTHWNTMHPEPLPGQPAMPPPRNPGEWLRWQTIHAELILGKKCLLCHQASAAALSDELALVAQPPNMLPSIVTTVEKEKWMPNAVFSHEAHQAVQCEGCHAARTSVNSTDVLLPGIATCQRCHRDAAQSQDRPVAAGHAQSGCFLCHLYHAWNKQGGQTPAGVPLDQLTHVAHDPAVTAFNAQAMRPLPHSVESR